MDPTDLDPNFTAVSRPATSTESNTQALLCQRREAFEEVGLPLGPHPHLHYLTRLPPFLSKYRLIVHPIVYLVSDITVIQALSPSLDEVHAIFDFPLRSCLSAALDHQDQQAGYTLSELGGADWPYEHDFHVSERISARVSELILPLQNSSDGIWLEASAYRMHRFRTSHTPLVSRTAG